MYRKTKRIVRKWIYILLSVFMVLSILTGTAAAVSAAPQKTAPDGVVLVNHLFGSKTTIDANGYAYDFTGLIQQDGTWYYITDGSWDSTYNGVYQNPNGKRTIFGTASGTAPITGLERTNPPTPMLFRTES